MTAGGGDLERERQEWERQQRRNRWLQDFGLLFLTLGVLVLIYIVLTYRP